jgi:hypothetical protein
MNPSWQFFRLPLWKMNQTTNYNESLNNSKHDITKTFGRETIQNSLDAKIPGETKPVHLRISWLEFEKDDFFVRNIDGLTSSLKKMPGGLDIQDNFQENPSFLILEDFNTTGLTGNMKPTDVDLHKDKESGKINNFYNYYYSLGESDKTGTQGGRRGTGRSTHNAASKLKTLFSLSKRIDDNKKFLMGYCLGEKFFDKNVQYYRDGTGYFCMPAEKEGDYVTPIFNNDAIQSLSDKLNLNRKDEPGLTTIIPYPLDELQPHVIITSILENYFAIIKSGKITIEINNNGEVEEFNANNVELKLIEYNLEHLVDVLSFIEKCNLVDEFVQLRDDTDKNSRIGKEDFLNLEDIEKIRKDFNADKIIAIKVPIKIKPKNMKSSVDSYFKIFLKKQPQNISQGKGVFIRGNMPLIEDGRKLEKMGVLGYMLAEDDALVTMMAHAENTNHTEINFKHSDLNKYYRIPYVKPLQMLKTSLESLATLLLNYEDEDDTTSFSNFFPTNEEIDNSFQGNESDYEINEDEEDDDEDKELKEKETKESNKKKNTNLGNLPKSKPKPYKIVKISKGSGIRIRANTTKDSIAAFFPKKLKLTIGYSEEGNKRSIKKNEINDIDFVSKNSSVKINTKEVDIIAKYKNTIEFNALNEDFYVDVKGLLINLFDPEIELKDL